MQEIPQEEERVVEVDESQRMLETSGKEREHLHHQTWATGVNLHRFPRNTSAYFHFSYCRFNPFKKRLRLYAIFCCVLRRYIWSKPSTCLHVCQSRKLNLQSTTPNWRVHQRTFMLKLFRDRPGTGGYSTAILLWIKFKQDGAGEEGWHFTSFYPIVFFVCLFF